MRRLLFLIIILMLLGSIELFAQYQYNFEFDVISPGPFTLEVWTKELSTSPEVLREPPSDEYGRSQLIPWNVNCPPTIYQIRVKAWSFYGKSFEEIRNPSLHSLNYFYIDLRAFLDPTPPNPTGGGDE